MGGADVTVTTSVSQQQTPLGTVQLIYTVGYGANASSVPLPMMPTRERAAGKGAGRSWLWEECLG